MFNIVPLFVYFLFSFNNTLRYFLEISYRGTPFKGWQVQPSADTVQQRINTALSTILQQDIIVTGSGRTDTGVHAHMQVAHFDTEIALSAPEYLYRFNAVLPPDISINQLYPVQENAHARFHAVSRRYVYYIHQVKNPFLQGLSYFYHPTLDLDTMNQAASFLEKAGRRDYACFSKSGHSSQTYNCDILQAAWYVLEKDRLVFTITADRFLRGMVRAIVGTLLEVGKHKISTDQFLQIIQSGDRSQAGRSVEACGLYLYEVKYPETILLLA